MPSKTAERSTAGRVARWLCIAACLFLAGCAEGAIALLPIAAPAIISGAGMGIAYTFTNIAYKTMSYPADTVLDANLKALRKMSITVLKKEVQGDSIEIKAETSRHTIYITIDRVTPTLTTIRVNAKRRWIFKDKTTAFEIIYQTELFLAGYGNGRDRGPGCAPEPGRGPSSLIVPPRPTAGGAASDVPTLLQPSGPRLGMFRLYGISSRPEGRLT